MSEKKPSTPQKMSRALRLKLSSFLAKLPKSKVKKTLSDLLAAVLIVGSFGLLAARIPELHDAYLMSHVGSKVYMIKSEPNSGGGTGFALKAPSGTSYIVTNSHVCDHVLKSNADENKGTVLVQDDNGNAMRRRVIAISDQTDLCIIEGLPGVEGLSLGDNPGKGDHMTVVGHPHLRPLTLSAGDIIGAMDVEILDHVISADNPLIAMMLPPGEGKCDMPKNEIKTLVIPPDEGGGSVVLCLVRTTGAYMTSITIYPGNSGSPMVDFWGNVEGVAFAANGNDNYGEVVSLPDLRLFIARY